MTIFADLHNHTTASDGDFTPDELVFKAKEQGISTIGVTDHDTLKGLGNAVAAGQNYGIKVITGVEVSIRFKRSFFAGTLHLLVYFPNDLLKREEFHDAFNKVLFLGRGEGLVHARVDEINKIFGPQGVTPVLEKELLFEEISKYSSNATRRHFALALEEIHNISSRSQINKLMGNASPAYIPSGVELGDIKAILNDYPVLAVLAHPAAGSFEGKGHYKEVLPPFETVEILFPEFINAGIKGLEVYYPGHSEKYANLLLALAKKHDLIVTGGSDCHDKNKRPFGENGIGKHDFQIFEKLLNAS